MLRGRCRRPRGCVSLLYAELGLDLGADVRRGSLVDVCERSGRHVEDNDIASGLRYLLDGIDTLLLYGLQKLICFFCMSLLAICWNS